MTNVRVFRNRKWHYVYGVILGICLCGVSELHAQGPQSAKQQAISDTYRNIYQIESLRIYSTARIQYKQLVESYLSQTEKGLTEEQITQLPAVISAAFRLSVVTAKENLNGQKTLTYQLESYDDTHVLLEKLILIVSSLRRKEQTSKMAYETLLFARAYNRLAWAYQLSTATPWKQYVVLPFSQIAGMIDMAKQDLEQALAFQDLVIPPVSERRSEGLLTRYTEQLNTKLSTLPKDSIEYRSYQLMNQEEKPEVLAQIMAKRNIYQTLYVIDTIQSPDVAQGLDLMSKTHDYNSSIGVPAQPIFASLEKIVRSIGIK